MARVTVEDCLEHIENRFALVHLAARRVRQLAKGSHRLILSKNKDVVTALREIAEAKVRAIKQSLPAKVD
jgi:DNA-directed RNA polymerase subunit omega